MEFFEEKTKNQFTGKKGSSIPMAGLGPRPDIKKHRLELSRNEIKDIFEPVISEILALIQDQIQQTEKEVKLILLVGGFGKSKYLESRVREMFGPDIEVISSLDRSVPVDHTVEGGRH